MCSNFCICMWSYLQTHRSLESLRSQTLTSQVPRVEDQECCHGRLFLAHLRQNFLLEIQVALVIGLQFLHDPWEYLFDSIFRACVNHFILHAAFIVGRPDNESKLILWTSIFSFVLDVHQSVTRLVFRQNLLEM